MFFISAIFLAVHLLVNKGILYCIAWVVSYVYLKLTCIFFRRRFDLYDFKADDDPEKLAFFVPLEEYRLESPQNALHLKKNADSVFFMGVNSQGESLTVRISRKPGSQVQCSAVLRSSSGCTYTLPEEHNLQTEVDEPRTFGSSRFKLQCLIPMRRWRVFFNGTLKETSPDKTSESKYRHVKFAFLWVASSDVFDYYSDMSSSVLNDAAARNTSWKWPPILLLQRLKILFNGYEQCGMLLGTVTMEGEPEKEMYLWGCRGHYMGKTYGIEDGDFEDIYVNSENGTFIHLGTMNIPGMIRNFTYGFVMRANGYIIPIEKCLTLEEDTTGVTKKVRVFSEGEEYTISVSKESDKMHFFKEYSGESSVTPSSSAYVNVMKGRSLIYEGTMQPDKAESVSIKQAILLSAKDGAPSIRRPLLSVSFQDPQCQLLIVSGGKGSSLAKLSVISDQLRSFIVPKGIAVTTTAYRSFIRGDLRDAVKKFERTAWKMSKEEIKSESQRLVSEVSNAKLPEAVKLSIQQSLNDIFGEQLRNKKFAVRSSATGEDTEQMSAAGQMETFLGCNGLEEIFEAVKKCWASQFSHTAVEYKRRYGQPLNTPMAVVIQEMVPCDAAGVIFTCDPVTGNPSFISITANYGLGESVVGASADPDTITLERDIYNEINFYSEAAGKKNTKIVMEDSGGTREIHVEGALSNEYCISRETAYMLGQIAVQVEEIFGTPRDIEWGVLDGKIYLFQSRPVTSIDTETDFEIKHSIDSAIRREDEYSTAANVGEVLIGAMSNLGMQLLLCEFDIATERHKYVKWEGEGLPNTPYITKRFTLAMNRLLFCVSDAFFRFSDSDESGEMSNYTKAMTVALFGRVVDDKKIFDMAIDRHKGEKSSENVFFRRLYILIQMFFAWYLIKRERKIKEYHFSIKKDSSSSEILRTIATNFSKACYVQNMHFDCTFSSALWNNTMLGVLTKARGAWDNVAFGDFGYLLSSCSDVESADVPAAIEELGLVITQCMKPEEFKKMKPEEAESWLQATPSKAGMKFREFLKRHGHRCVKEFDIYSVPWEEDPKSLVKILQNLAGTIKNDQVKKSAKSVGEVLSKLRVKLSFLDSLKLRLLLPFCQRGVRSRELSKSLLVMKIHKERMAFRKLADALVEEGRLPNKELLYFLEQEELRQLIETRSPRLVAKAFRRWKVYPELDKLVFPETMSGIPKPINMDEDIVIPDKGFAMTGVPVSQGVVKGTARVVMKLEEANKIQPGDILITYATDIGWTPYFALLSGVATELGGLISHGAVVAREYGLPCVVNLHGATRVFASGDQVLLDGNRGVVQKIET